MNATNSHVFSHGMQDTRETLDTWREGNWTVLRSWVALSVSIALSLLVAVWFVAGQLTPDLTPVHISSLTEPSKPTDMLPILWRNSLVLALHGFACIAGFIAGASMPIAADQRTGISRWIHVKAAEVRDPLRLRRHPLLALHPGVLPRLPVLDDLLPVRRLAPDPDPHRPPARGPGADGAVPAARRLADRQPPR